MPEDLKGQDREDALKATREQSLARRQKRAEESAQQAADAAEAAKKEMADAGVDQTEEPAAES